MKIQVVNIGPTDIPYLQEGIAHYLKRLRHYVPVEMICTPEIKAAKTASPEYIREQEGNLILRNIENADIAVLLDEHGKQMSSEAFAAFIQRYMNRGTRYLAFVTGGAFGFSPAVYTRVSEKISLSSMTFPHQMARLIFVEQLYRAFTILKGESYHHI
jgi:23S rRNA (pseudouridine1915-N3)-methyltransferase